MRPATSGTKLGTFLTSKNPPEVDSSGITGHSEEGTKCLTILVYMNREVY